MHAAPGTARARSGGRSGVLVVAFAFAACAGGLSSHPDITVTEIAPSEAPPALGPTPGPVPPLAEPERPIAMPPAAIEHAAPARSQTEDEVTQLSGDEQRPPGRRRRAEEAAAARRAARLTALRARAQAEAAAAFPPPAEPAPPAPQGDAVVPPSAPAAPALPEVKATDRTTKRWEPEPAASNDGVDPGAAALIAAVDFHRLQALAEDRATRQSGSPPRIAVGDLIGIHAEQVGQVSQTVRVAPQGTIELQLVGALPAAGRTVPELVADLESRLSRWVQKPKVEVFLSGAQASQVIVTGMVARPGAYPLGSSRSTILEVLAQAGGPSESAGPTIELTPATAETVAGEASDPIVIRMADIARVNEGQAADVFLASGDRLHVPEGGTYSVEGWVDRPGIFEITRRSTVTAAIFAAGGSQFPASLGDVEIEHRFAGGETTTSVIDVEAILDGDAEDVALQPGDVVRVSSAELLIPPWALYQAARALFWGLTFPFWHPFSVAG